ncbi:hypothetical protein ASC59_15515 [Leifsonia sp. Root1293]|nr:hypothetical protein ASC59_15515 [Leifsonia sp. Root1293]KRA09153.1 hypothetical protein ASD61_15510 [Leifsonia sp. Root60]
MLLSDAWHLRFAGIFEMVTTRAGDPVAALEVANQWRHEQLMALRFESVSFATDASLHTAVQKLFARISLTSDSVSTPLLDDLINDMAEVVWSRIGTQGDEQWASDPFWKPPVQPLQDIVDQAVAEGAITPEQKVHSGAAHLRRW